MNLLYARLPIKFDKIQFALEHFKSIPDNEWYWEGYRTTLTLPLFSPDGASDKNNPESLKNRKDATLQWTKYADKYTKEFCESLVFPFMEPLPKIVLLKTKSSATISPHIDCSIETFNQVQHKLRIVLQGDVTTLKFITKKGDVAPKTNHSDLFVIDGSWPHYMTNTSDDYKYTLCFGAPWQGNLTSGYKKLLESAADKLQVNNNSLPDDYEKYFDTPEKRKKRMESNIKNE